MSTHIPVLLNETIEGLAIKKDGVYADLTLGRAGHSREILARLSPRGFLLGVDQDEEALSESQKRLSPIGLNFRLVRGNFTDIDLILEKNGIQYLDGVLMDIGVSSPQFDNPERGFSYREDARLDMRMDRSKNFSAYDIVNTYSFEELCKIFRDYGDEKYAPRIADNIIKDRKIAPIETTFQLVDIIKRSKPAKELNKPGHPAKQVFQALRIETNDEFGALKNGITKVLRYLRPGGGRLAVITFHSGEDRIVKNLFRDATEVIGDRFDGPMRQNEKEYRLVNSKPITAKESELENNRRSHSAKLRIIERK